MDGKPTFDDYFLEIKKILKKNNVSEELTLIVEPGMALIGKNISYICSVIDFKQTKNNFFAVTDGSRIHISYGGFRLDIDEGADKSTLRDTLSILQKICS